MLALPPGQAAHPEPPRTYCRLQVPELCCVVAVALLGRGDTQDGERGQWCRQRDPQAARVRPQRWCRAVGARGPHRAFLRQRGGRRAGDRDAGRIALLRGADERGPVEGRHVPVDHHGAVHPAGTGDRPGPGPVRPWSPYRAGRNLPGPRHACLAARRLPQPRCGRLSPRARPAHAVAGVRSGPQRGHPARHTPESVPRKDQFPDLVGEHRSGIRDRPGRPGHRQDSLRRLPVGAAGLRDRLHDRRPAGVQPTQTRRLRRR